MKTMICALCCCSLYLCSNQLLGQKIFLHPALVGIYPAGSVADSHNTFGFVSNPANVSTDNRNFIGIFDRQPYLLKDLNNFIAVASCSGLQEDSRIGVCYARNDFSGYHQCDAMLSYGQHLHKDVLLGLQLGARSTRYPASKAQIVPFAKLGFQLLLEEKYNLGFCIMQYMEPSNATNKFYLPSSIQAGLGVSFTKEFFMAIDFRQAAGLTPELLLFTRYTPHRLVSVNWGMNILEGEIDVAFSFQLQRMNIGLSTAYHPQLGLSPGLRFSYLLNKTK